MNNTYTPRVWTAKELADQAELDIHQNELNAEQDAYELEGQAELDAMHERDAELYDYTNKKGGE